MAMNEHTAGCNIREMLSDACSCGAQPSFTAGPWAVTKFKDTKAFSIYAKGGIASLASAKREEDARMMAAAPELLGALEAILFQVCQGAVLERDACIAQARAARAKARGDGAQP